MNENIKNKSIEIKHSELTRVGDSKYKSICPVCGEGFLNVQTDNDSLILINDRCTKCSQGFIYTDIPDSTITKIGII